MSDHVYDSSCEVCTHPHEVTDRLRAECDGLRAELQRVEAQLEEELETVHAMNEALAEAFPDLRAQMGERP